MESPPNINQTVSYQMTRDLLLPILFRRTLFRWRQLRVYGLLLLAAVLLYSSGEKGQYIAYFMIALMFLFPWFQYRAVARAIDQNPQSTDRKSITFSPSGLAVVGPNYNSNLDWTFFQAFSEDQVYFYLHLAGGFDSILPKSAFTLEQQAKFRQFANIRHA